MAGNTYSLTGSRLGKFKGEILAHAMHKEVLGRGGRQVAMPKNSSDTYVARRVIPYGATAANYNQFFQNSTLTDRGNAMVQAHQTQEGVTSTPDSISFMDVTTIINQFDCLYMWTDKTALLHEDDVPKLAVEQVGERVGLVNEMILWGILRSCTNQFYGGTGTGRTSVNGKLTLGLVRKVTKSLQANHASMVNSTLKASGDFATAPVEAGFFVYAHTDLAPDIRDMPGFIHVKEYASGTPMPGELGAVEDFRFILSPDLPSIQDAASTITASTYGLVTTGGTNPDVYQCVVAGKDAWSQLSVRGLNSLDPTYLPTGKKDKGDPHGQRGYAGTIWWKGAAVENDGWLAIINVGASVIS